MDHVSLVSLLLLLFFLLFLVLLPLSTIFVSCLPDFLFLSFSSSFLNHGITVVLVRVFLVSFFVCVMRLVLIGCIIALYICCTQLL